MKTEHMFFKEFLLFVLKRKKYYLIPILLILLTLGGLVFFTQGSAVAPFIYTVF